MINMEEIVALCKRRGFIYPSSDIYGGIAGFWDYGPLGVELKNNIKKEWWKKMVYQREDIVGLDASIIMNPVVWEKSGHVAAFSDPLVECKLCHKRFRADKIEEKNDHSKNQHPGLAIEFTDARQFNLLVKAELGVVEKEDVYLRGEITQGVFVNFKNVVDSTRIKIPFGIAQIGKAFRNEVTPGNFTFRSREFEQMEVEYFIKPEDQEGQKWFEYWKKERMDWYLSLGFNNKNLRFRDHRPDERAHYARFATDIEYQAPFGWSEFEGIHHRGDWDLSRHKLTYKDQLSNSEYTPWVIETSGGVDRATLFFLIDAYHEETIKDKTRVYLKLHPKLAPIKVAIFPLQKDEKISSIAKEVYHALKKDFVCEYDDAGNIGKMYRRQDEIGTPFCVTIDYQTIDEKSVTVRNRDTMQQERIPVEKLKNYIFEKL